MNTSSNEISHQIVLAEVTRSSSTTHSTTTIINTTTINTMTTVTTNKGSNRRGEGSENQRSPVGDYDDFRFCCSCPHNHSCCCHHGCHHGCHHHPRWRSCCCHCQYFAIAADAATTTAFSTAYRRLPPSSTGFPHRDSRLYW